MSKLIIKNKCIFCDKILPLENEEGYDRNDIIIIKRANLVNYHKERWKEYFNVKEGYSRIKYLRGSPSGGIHINCWKKLIMSYNRE